MWQKVFIDDLLKAGDFYKNPKYALPEFFDGFSGALYLRVEMGYPTNLRGTRRSNSAGLRCLAEPVGTMNRGYPL